MNWMQKIIKNLWISSLEDESCQEDGRAAADRDYEQVSVDPGHNEAHCQSRSPWPHIIRDSDDRGESHDRQGDVGNII